METQSPGAGPSRRAYVEDVEDEDCASISSESSSPYDHGPRVTSRSVLLEVDTSSSSRSRSVRSVSIQVDLIPPPAIPLRDRFRYIVSSPAAGQADAAGTPRFGHKPGEWCKCTVDLENGRNLVVCIDGTANQFGRKNTNVVELYSRLDKDKTQLTYYNSGIGTYVKPGNWLKLTKQALVNGWDMAVAWNLKKIILDAYRWLSENYQPGDCIFLFGFSRGAYQVRIIAGMIKIVGLLHKGNNEQIEFAYELYLANLNNEWKNLSWSSKLFRSQAKHKKTVEELQKICDQFKQTLSHKNATVHFVGIWDTVSSVGIVRGPSFPETTNGMKDVCGCRHGLSLDECRDKFQPEYVGGGAGPALPFWKLPDGEQHRVKEVWFVGSHSDIGGGNSDNVELNSYGPALRWMLYEALKYGLKVELSVKGWGAPEHKPSMTWVWRILEVYPFRRLTYKDQDSTERWPPHLARGRHIQKNQLIHESVARYMKDVQGYVPKAHFPEDYNFWEDWEAVRNVPDTKYPFEQDADSPAIEDLTQLYNASMKAGGITPEDLGALHNLMKLRGGSQSIIDAAPKGSPGLLFDTLRRTVALHKSAPSSHTIDVIVALTDTLAVFPAPPENATRYTKDLLNSWLKHAKANSQQKILEVFQKNSLCDPIRGHLDAVWCVTYSPDGKHIASASGDDTIRLWDAVTGDPFGEPLRGHTGIVSSVAFSPDAQRIVSGSADDTLRLWDAATQQPIGQPLNGHDRGVHAVAFFPDGQQIVSGPYDKTLLLWDAVTQSAVGEPLRGHTDSVLSVAVSPDGTRIASGSNDRTIRIWNAATREVVRVLEGHSGPVMSVVFSPDGKRVISGSDDSTVRVWDVDTGKTVLGPLRGHDSYVLSVAVSPDGRYIASGADDKMVRLWDAGTGEAVGEPLWGHTSWVWSVAFSPDSRRIVSGSNDRTLRIWDIEGHVTKNAHPLN